MAEVDTDEGCLFLEVGQPDREDRDITLPMRMRNVTTKDFADVHINEVLYSLGPVERVGLF